MTAKPGLQRALRSSTLRGVENVHVADASVFPAIPNGNVHSTVVSVAAEFAARLAEQMEVDSGH